MIAGYFGTGIYLLIFLVLMGTVIPFWDDQISISTGIGIKDTLNLIEGMKGAMDSMFKLHLSVVLIIAFGIFTVSTGYKLWKEKDSLEKAERVSRIAKWAALGVGLILLLVIPPVAAVVNRCSVPIVTLFFILLVSALCQFITKTKLGQDFKAVGQSQRIAEVSGINVDKTRIIAVILSTVLAAWGQVIFLQNVGTLNTYNAHTQVGMFAVASILVGGASTSKATVSQALIGTILFNAMFIMSPEIGQAVFGQALLGEYFRTFMVYGVIGFALGLYVWKANRKSKLTI